MSALPEGWKEALADAEGLSPGPNAIARIAERHGPEAARWAVGQWELRRRARAKFSDAERMLFDRDGLEMATHLAVASHRARRFPAGERVADLTAGIGGDLIEIARRGPAIAYETDPIRRAMGEWNLAGLPVEWREGDALAVEWDFDYAFADPMRRTEGRRTLRPEDFEPDPVRLAERMRELRLAAIKLSPMLDDRFLEGLGGRLEFLSFDGECREALVWLGSEAGTGRAAVHVESGETLVAGPPPERRDDADRWIAAADPAAIRAHALGVLAARHGLCGLADSNGFLTGPTPVESAWLRAMPVLWQGALDVAEVKRALRDHDRRVVAIKTRGPAQDLAALSRKVRHDGSHPAVLWVYPNGRRLRAVLADPERP